VPAKTRKSRLSKRPTAFTVCSITMVFAVLALVFVQLVIFQHWLLACNSGLHGQMVDFAEKRSLSCQTKIPAVGAYKGLG
jgi:hypothetical protein